MSNPNDILIHSSIDSRDALPMVEELDHEYTTRYADYEGFDKPADAPSEIELFPPLVFSAPYGDFLLLQRDGRTIAGGAFMYLDRKTAEIKRVWTSAAHRRQGLSRRIMAELEGAIAARGYRQIYLTTGPRQPEAKNLYLKLGYTPLFDLNEDPEKIGALPFEKVIAPDNTGPRLRGVSDRWRGLRQRRTVERTYRWRPRPEQRLTAQIGADVNI
ncbi:GNAT family N-acetyltransferase [Corynebacterium pacaense]|uniref:GNAT family N-acetyltransferase n=1 Tax=Corynebacterium pacaense TaxID=1816684 RepID=UPI001FE981DD|nr:GNAT family N-acetyltransferase [Corynebacterium pacaense]